MTGEVFPLPVVLRIKPGCGAILFSLLVLAAGPQLDAQSGGPPSPSSLSGLSQALQSISDRVSPAVVQLFIVRYASPQLGSLAENLLTQERSTGSGVLVSPDGYIVTNAHVIRGARRVQVRLVERREKIPSRTSILQAKGRLLQASIVGIDAETDLGILKIEAQQTPYLEFGNSDDLRQGQLVLALGSPLGLDNSVSLGVVSSVARQLKPEDPMIYIQTDAPINPGNSGGPLVNTSGEMVGINTLIFSQSGGHEGIGFAAPSNIVRHVYQEIRSQGRVRRGHLGIKLQTVTPLLAAGLGLAQDWGVIVADIPPGGPAALSGLRIKDLILSLDGKMMENARQLEVNVYSRPPGQSVSLGVLRGSQTVEIRTRVIERQNDLERFAQLVDPSDNLIPSLGILGLEITAEIAAYLPPPRKLGGVLVAARAADAPYWDTGLLPGDVIHQVNGTDIIGISDLRSGLKQIQSGDPVVIQVQRQGELIFVAFQLD